VLKGRLALIAPSLSCGAFMYEEGEDLEEGEASYPVALLEVPLRTAPVVNPVPVVAPAPPPRAPTDC